MAERLDATAWTEMGLRVLADEGIEAVRVEPLARTLGVTKGSFYWHFSDRRELLDSLLLRWKQWATEDVIESVERASNEPSERLRELTRLVFRHGGPLDRAVRAGAPALHIARGRTAHVPPIEPEASRRLGTVQPRAGARIAVVVAHRALSLRVPWIDYSPIVHVALPPIFQQQPNTEVPEDEREEEVLVLRPDEG